MAEAVDKLPRFWNGLGITDSRLMPADQVQEDAALLDNLMEEIMSGSGVTLSFGREQGCRDTMDLIVRRHSANGNPLLEVTCHPGPEGISEAALGFLATLLKPSLSVAITGLFDD